MRYKPRLAMLALVSTIAVPATVQADALSDCRSASRPQARLSACSEVIGGAFTGEQKAVAYRNRGRARTEAGALEEAIADLGEAIRLAPGDVQAYLYRAQARIGRGDTDGAIADYGEAIRLRPTMAMGFTGRGHAHLIKRDGKAAIADFSEAIRLDPKSASALNNRGLAHRAAGNEAAAIDDFTAAITLNPIYALAYANRGYAHERAGRKREAAIDYARALLLDSSLTGARDGLARVGEAGELGAEVAKAVGDGKALVEAHCSGCHATGVQGESRHPKAPPFRTLHQRHPWQSLREPLTRGIAAPHDEMPKFRLPDADVDKIVAYINSLEVRR